jgi:hypothetical protein
MLEFNSTNYPNTVLTPTNSEILLLDTGGSVIATSDELTITQPGATSSDGFIFAVSDTLDFPYTVSWQFQGGDLDPAEEIITNSPASSSLTDPFDQGLFTYPDDPFIVTLPAIVPVPAAVWLFGSGLLGLVAVARRKKSA